jgi:hypothetical protein
MIYSTDFLQSHILKFLMSNDLRIVSRCLMVGGREEPLLNLISFLSHFLTETWSLDVPNRREKLWVYNTYYIAEEIQKFGALSKATRAFAESIESFIEDQAFSLSYDLATPPPHSPLSSSASCLSFSDFLCVAGQAYWRDGGGGGDRSQIIWRSESLVLCKSLNTLWALALAFLLNIFDIFLAV